MCFQATGGSTGGATGSGAATALDSVASICGQFTFGPKSSQTLIPFLIRRLGRSTKRKFDRGKPQTAGAFSSRHPCSADFPVCGLWGLSSPHAELESSANPQTGKSALRAMLPDRPRSGPVALLALTALDLQLSQRMSQRSADQGGFLVVELLCQPGFGPTASLLRFRFVDVLRFDGHVGH